MSNVSKNNETCMNHAEIKDTGVMEPDMNRKETNDPGKNSTKRKYLRNAVFLLILVGLTIWFVFKDQDIGEIWKLLKAVPLGYKLCCIVLVILYVCSESVIIKYLFSRLDIKVSLWECIRYSFVGFFYSCVTPSASGGQPMQMYYMKKRGIRIANSMIVLMVVTIEYKLVLVLVGLGLVLFDQSLVASLAGEVRFFLYLGLGLNVICVSAMIMLIIFPEWVGLMADKLYSLLVRLHIIKYKKNWLKRIHSSVDAYRSTAGYLKSNMMVMFQTMIISVLQRFFLFAVTYVVYRSMGYAEAGFVKIVILQSVISVAVDMLPLPGGLGISEHLYLLIFTPVFGTDFYATASMALSRGFSYYALLLISGGVALVAHFTLGKRNTQ